MARIAYLGPEYTFSHDLVRKIFKGEDHISYKNLEKVVAAIALGKCDKGVVPFYNTTRRSIEETQLCLVKYGNKVFVMDVISWPVEHYLCGFGKFTDVKEVRSKNVVFEQTSDWLSRHLPKIRKNGKWNSTAEAVQSLLNERPRRVAAIGSKSACKGYRVPILKPEIQNQPNFTGFFVLYRNAPSPAEADHVLMYLQDCLPAEKRDLSEIVAQHGCGLSSNWSVRSKKKEVYFFEMNGEFCMLDLRALVQQIKRRFRKSFILGAYNRKSITSLLFEGN